MIKGRYYFIIQILFLITSLTSCGQTTYRDRVKDIILINSSGEKCEVSQIIEAVDKCGPKVIGLNLLFSKNENGACDRALLTVLEKSGKVILTEGLYDSLSDESFYEKAKYTGETGLPRHDSNVADFYYRVAEYEARYSFPFLIALHYDMEKRSQLVSKSFPKAYPINYVHEQKDFQTITKVTAIANHCDLIKGKIVIIGNLGQADRDIQLIKFNNHATSKLNRTVLLANVILDILKDLDTPDVQINKYSEFIMRQQLNKD